MEEFKNPDIRVMGSQMRENFDKYYGDLGKTNVMMLVAVVLDPRYKFRFVKFSLKKLFPMNLVEVDGICDHLYDVLKKLFDFVHSIAASSSNNDAHVSRFCDMDVDGNGKGDVSNNEKMKKMYDEFDEEDELDDSGVKLMILWEIFEIRYNEFNFSKSLAFCGS
ncbi:Zinc finger BED domain-containing protein RICESLEEPER 3 [Bienertia sinuspersici]